jgi:hypothetical protein
MMRRRRRKIRIMVVVAMAIIQFNSMYICMLT